MNPTQCMIKELEKMARECAKEIFIYYAEDMSKIEDNIWSVDVMCDRLNNACGPMAWTWTIMSAEEDKAYRKEFEDDSPLEDYEIVVHDQEFSDEVVCHAIQTWLIVNDLDHLGFNVKIIKFEDAAPYSGYVKSLMERDIEEELKNAVPLENIIELL